MTALAMLCLYVQALRIMRSKGWGLRPERGLYQAALTACYCEGDEEMGKGLR